MAIRLVRHEKKEKIYDHALMTNRELPDQHPIVAISGLKDFLDNITKEIADINDSITDRIVVGGNENVVIEIQPTDWYFDPINNEYFKVINHALQTENMIVEFYNAEKRNEIISYQIVDGDSIQLFVDAPQYVKVILNASLGHLSENLRTIRTSDFIDDTAIRSNKSWSSSQIASTLLLYPKRSEVYTKNQADIIFASKLKEHSHNNLEILEKFSVDVARNLYFNGVKIGSNVRPTLEQITWTRKTFSDMTMIVDTSDVFRNLNGVFLTGSEIILHNDYDSISDSVDITRPLVLQIVDSGIVIADTIIMPGQTQKYVLGVSPNLQVLVKGYFTGKYYVEAITTMDNINMYPDIINDRTETATTVWSSTKTANTIMDSIKKKEFDVVSSTNITCNHNLNTKAIHVTVWANDEELVCSKRIIDENNVLITHTSPFTGTVIIS